MSYRSKTRITVWEYYFLLNSIIEYDIDSGHNSDENSQLDYSTQMDNQEIQSHNKRKSDNEGGTITEENSADNLTLTTN